MHATCGIERYYVPEGTMSRSPTAGKCRFTGVEELDWKAYAIIFRLHELDHLSQAKKTLKAARASSR